ncbi:hypothetical protein F3Y22_tig00117048pilonHSYRG00981 [Hibiscus syriacus]|uniref:Uncharacterized protein n=1 Tax=Hibiscus syriacus TaxID=106335 RepID=A0A6A2WM48_HIBSY|nr:hypothetical protein F3Y22_tig00117048pilonHSYRG00981 [Hibiscus syriacus]
MNPVFLCDKDIPTRYKITRLIQLSSEQYFVDENDTVPQKVNPCLGGRWGLLYWLFTRKVREGCIFGVPDLTKSSLTGICYAPRVHFKSEDVNACIVTCGGLCPRINTVIREIVCGLYHMGFYAKNTVTLTPKAVDDIHKRGDTILGTLKGAHNSSKTVDRIQDRVINQNPEFVTMVKRCFEPYFLLSSPTPADSGCRRSTAVDAAEVNRILESMASG